MSNHSHALKSDLRAKEIAIEHLFLDPNNPRFVGSGWQDVPDDRATERSVQAEAQDRLLDHFDADKLRLNMEINGYLPIDRIVVREIGEGDYLVLEGNRRVCAAKELKRVAAVVGDILPEIVDSVSQIPCLVYVGDDPQAAWTFQGLRHITGIKDWPAFNKAKLLVTQMETDGLTLTEVGNRFGLTAFGAGQWARGYHAFIQACEESDYSEEVNENSYPFFQELFGRSSFVIREWIDWDSDEFRFRNSMRFNEFVGWLYPRPEDPETDGTRGDWGNRRLQVRDSLRSLAIVYKQDIKTFEEFRRGGLSVEEAYARVVSAQYEKQVDRKQEVFDSIETCTGALENLPFVLIVDKDLKVKLQESIVALKKAIAAVEGAI